MERSWSTAPLLIFSLWRQYHPSVFFSFFSSLLDSTGSKESYLTYSIKSISKISAGEDKKERAARIHQDKHSDKSNSLFPRYIRWSACKRNKRVGKMINKVLFIWDKKRLVFRLCTFPIRQIFFLSFRKEPLTVLIVYIRLYWLLFLFFWKLKKLWYSLGKKGYLVHLVEYIDVNFRRVCK